MKAITVDPKSAHSLALEDRPEPTRDGSTLLVQAVALGVCGTDHEVIEGDYGMAPPGRHRLILGHESLGRVIEAPQDSGFAKGDLVVGIVRRPDPVPCRACAAGEWDMCLNGLHVEHGIRGLDGYGVERFALEPAFAVTVDRDLGLLGVLLEPASVLAKAWDHIDRIGHRTKSWKPGTLLVTGAGPVGLLAALMGKQRGLDVHVLDIVSAGPKPELVAALGGTYHAGTAPQDFRPDIIVECTGAAAPVKDAMTRIGTDGIVCLVGVSPPHHVLPLDLGAFNRDTVLNNHVVFGTVNANRHHYELGAEALAAADRDWLGRLITRRVPLARWKEAFERRKDDIKVVLTFGDGT